MIKKMDGNQKDLSTGKRWTLSFKSAGIAFTLQASSQEFRRTHDHLAQKMAHIKPLSCIPRKIYE